MDLSALSLLADVAEGFDWNTSASSKSKSKSLLAIQILTEMRVRNKKVLLLSDLGKGLRVPKRKRSKLSDRRRTDLLAFCVPKRKRSGDLDHQTQTPKRQKTTPALQLGMSCSSQEIKSKIDIPPRFISLLPEQPWSVRAHYIMRLPAMKRSTALVIGSQSWGTFLRQP